MSEQITNYVDNICVFIDRDTNDVLLKDIHTNGAVAMNLAMFEDLVSWFNDERATWYKPVSVIHYHKSTEGDYYLSCCGDRVKFIMSPGENGAIDLFTDDMQFVTCKECKEIELRESIESYPLNPNPKK